MYAQNNETQHKIFTINYCHTKFVFLNVLENNLKNNYNVNFNDIKT